MGLKLWGPALAAVLAYAPADAAVQVSGRVEGTETLFVMCPPGRGGPCDVVTPVAFNIELLLSDLEIVNNAFFFQSFGGPLRDFSVSGQVVPNGAFLTGLNLQFGASTIGIGPGIRGINASAPTFSAVRTDTIVTTSNRFTITQVAPVPEPATWAMMLVGFGAVGYSLRSRRKLTATFASA